MESKVACARNISRRRPPRMDGSVFWNSMKTRRLNHNVLMALLFVFPIEPVRRDEIRS